MIFGQYSTWVRMEEGDEIIASLNGKWPPQLTMLFHLSPYGGGWWDRCLAEWQSIEELPAWKVKLVKRWILRHQTKDEAGQTMDSWSSKMKSAINNKLSSSLQTQLTVRIINRENCGYIKRLWTLNWKDIPCFIPCVSFMDCYHSIRPTRSYSVRIDFVVLALMFFIWVVWTWQLWLCILTVAIVSYCLNRYLDIV